MLNRSPGASASCPNISADLQSSPALSNRWSADFLRYARDFSISLSRVQMQFEMRADDVNPNAALGQDSQGNMHILRRGVVHIGGGVNKGQPPQMPDQRTRSGVGRDDALPTRSRAIGISQYVASTYTIQPRNFAPCLCAEQNLSMAVPVCVHCGERHSRAPCHIYFPLSTHRLHRLAT